jgi:hypothetical protein
MLTHQRTHGHSTLQTFTRWLLAGARPGQSRPLPRLTDVHPERPAGGRWVGMRTVPTECVAGTASTAGSRGQDFRPLKGREPADWQFRWWRLRSATRDQVILPPVQLLRAGGCYWVIDGHNRVALARERGQLWIDAEITELDLGSQSSAACAAKEN